MLQNSNIKQNPFRNPPAFSSPGLNFAESLAETGAQVTKLVLHSMILVQSYLLCSSYNWVVVHLLYEPVLLKPQIHQICFCGYSKRGRRTNVTSVTGSVSKNNLRGCFGTRIACTHSQNGHVYHIFFMFLPIAAVADHWCVLGMASKITRTSWGQKWCYMSIFVDELQHTVTLYSKHLLGR